MFCPECGKEIPEESLFCEHCGSAISKEEYLELFDDSYKEPADVESRALVTETVEPEIADVPEGISLTEPAIFDESAIEESLIKEEIAAEKPISSSKKSKAGVVIICACVCLVIVIGIFVGLHLFGNKPKTSEGNDDGSIIVIDNPAPSPEPSVNLLDTMTAEEKRALNIFLSNFSEASLGFYEDGMVDEGYWLINFAYNHTVINNPDKLIAAENVYAITANEVNRILNKFFGKTVPLEDVHTTTGEIEISYVYFADAYDGVFYSDSGYWLPGEVLNFSLATNLSDNGDGTYTAKFNTFFVDVTDEAYVSADIYGFDVSVAEENDYMLSETGSAVIKKKQTTDGKQTYELVKYYSESIW